MENINSIVIECSNIGNSSGISKICNSMSEYSKICNSSDNSIVVIYSTGNSMISEINR